MDYNDERIRFSRGFPSPEVSINEFPAKFFANPNLITYSLYITPEELADLPGLPNDNPVIESIESIESITLNARTRDFLANGQNYLQENPRIKGLHLRGFNSEVLAADQIATIFNIPELAQLRELSLAGGSGGAYAMEAMCSSPYLRNIEELDLASCYLNNAGFSTLATAKAFPNLRILDISSQGMSDFVYRRDYEDCNIGTGSIAMLAESGNYKHLRELRAEGVRFNAEDIASLKLFTKLRALSLGKTYFNHMQEAISLFPDAEVLGQLRRLRLGSFNQLLPVLAGKPAAANLRSIDVRSENSGDRFNPEVTSVLKASENLKDCSILVNRNQVEDKRQPGYLRRPRKGGNAMFDAPNKWQQAVAEPFVGMENPDGYDKPSPRGWKK